MFDSLDERIRQDEAMTKTKRWLEAAAVLGIAVLLFVVLYLVIQFMQ